MYDLDKITARLAKTENWMMTRDKTAPWTQADTDRVAESISLNRIATQAALAMRQAPVKRGAALEFVQQMIAKLPNAEDFR